MRPPGPSPPPIPSSHGSLLEAHGSMLGSPSASRCQFATRGLPAQADISTLTRSPASSSQLRDASRERRSTACSGSVRTCQCRSGQDRDREQINPHHVRQQPYRRDRIRRYDSTRPRRLAHSRHRPEPRRQCQHGIVRPGVRTRRHSDNRHRAHCFDDRPLSRSPGGDNE